MGTQTNKKTNKKQTNQKGQINTQSTNLG